MRDIDLPRFLSRPELRGSDVTLTPLGPEHLDETMQMLADPESARLTGTHASFTRDEVRMWLEQLTDTQDRADWTVTRSQDGLYLGEAVLNELDMANHSVNFRIALAGPDAIGRGYGTQATRLVVDFAFSVGIHRVSLDVFDFNPRAQRVYEKCGFVVEGVMRDTLLWDGVWYDSIMMSAINPR